MMILYALLDSELMAFKAAEGTGWSTAAQLDSTAERDCGTMFVKRPRGIHVMRIRIADLYIATVCFHRLRSVTSIRFDALGHLPRSTRTSLHPSQRRSSRSKSEASSCRRPRHIQGSSTKRCGIASTGLSNDFGDAVYGSCVQANAEGEKQSSVHYFGLFEVFRQTHYF